MNILILGHTGKMGTALKEVLKDHELAVASSASFDADKLLTNIFEFRDFDVIINCVAFMSIDACEENMDKALRINTLFPTLVASKTRAVFVHFSTDGVFTCGGPFYESDPVDPPNWYGLTKSWADSSIPLVNPRHYICRIPVLFGESNSDQFVEKMLAKEGDLKIADDIISSPTYSKDVARKVKWLIETVQPFGLYHVANEGIASLYDLMKEILENLGSDAEISRSSYRYFHHIGEKNTHTPLGSEKTDLMRPWQEAVEEYCHNLGGGDG